MRHAGQVQQRRDGPEERQSPRQPAQGGERYEPVRADYDQSPKAMPNARKAEAPSIGTDAVVQDKVTAINADLDAISEEGDNTGFEHT